MKLTAERNSAIVKRLLIALAPLALFAAACANPAPQAEQGFAAVGEPMPSAVPTTPPAPSVTALPQTSAVPTQSPAPSATPPSAVLTLTPAPSATPPPRAETISHHSVAAQGPTSPEELVFLSEIVARVRLTSAELGSLPYYGESAPAFVFRFRVVEYLKGSGGDDLAVRVVARYPSASHYADSSTPDADLALRTAKSWLAQRDTRWDDREALVFLRPSTVTEGTRFYEFTWRHPGPTWLDGYAVTSADNRAWLPASAPFGDAAFNSSEPLYLTHPLAGSLPPSISSAAPISLSEVEALIEANEDMLAKGEGVPGYEECVRERFETDARHRAYPRWPNSLERHIPSGQPSGHRLWPTAGQYEESAFYARWWTTGPDADLFIFRIVDDPDNDPSTDYAWEEIATRPIPHGTYLFYANHQSSRWSPCDYNPEALQDLDDTTVIAIAPAGTLHEAFFDPAAMDGGGVGADMSNGVLKPAAFSRARGMGISLQSVQWRQFAVEMRLDPMDARARLAGYHADFIALDGSVSLRLDFDDAVETTGEGGSRALSWPVCFQRWEAGDLLMLRISESSPDLIGTTRDDACANAPTPTPLPATMTPAPTHTPTPIPTAAPTPAE